ncbi:ErfK/YbiS/YcfS/YnhG family protein [Methylomonas methanica MC09]|uniref:ErfK/YbiS/YcfS/YnhG family protein n=1 Tax=Methylomonas methanica (strain DSM 25384 / MC09) TaxID=857087 RepID=G0A1D0_METMM|nr:ErfK/YbiS/YcfS/YnhG family protein [Methylomonas methanica MC09]
MRRKILFRNVLLSLCFTPYFCAADPDVRLIIDTQTRNLEILKGNEIIEVLDHVVIGRKGAGTKEHRGDDITPLGNYRIGWINEKSAFRKFFGLTYPNLDHAEKALQKGRIDHNTYEAIVKAEFRGQIPPQNTDLGGQIGIHGLGSGSLSVHEVFDWTHGCIALTNDQIDRLSQYVEKGTLVTVK